jgi:S1-C subfamily serine protease
VESAREVVQRIAMLEPGQAVVLGVDRGDRSLTLTAEVGRRPSGS